MKQLLFFAFITTVCFACNTSTCTNTNPVFEKFSPESVEYKTELAKVLRAADAKALTFWFSGYKEAKGRDYLYFKVKGDGICAVIQMVNRDWRRLADLRIHRGEGYRGAEFVNVKYDIVEDSGRIEFVFRSFSEIID